MVRYADDFVILCRSPEEAQMALEPVRQWTAAAGLTLHPTKTHVVDATSRASTSWATGSSSIAASRAARAWINSGDDTRQDATHRRPEPADHHRRHESHAAWLVRILQTQPTEYVPVPRRLDPHASAQHPAQTSGRPRSRTWSRSTTLAQRLLCQAWVVQLEYRPCLGPSILTEVKPSTGEPYAGDPHARFGGRGDRTQSVLPTPIRRFWPHRCRLQKTAATGAFLGRILSQAPHRALKESSSHDRRTCRGRRTRRIDDGRGTGPARREAADHRSAGRTS